MYLRESRQVGSDPRRYSATPPTGTNIASTTSACGEQVPQDNAWKDLANPDPRTGRRVKIYRHGQLQSIATIDHPREDYIPLRSSPVFNFNYWTPPSVPAMESHASPTVPRSLSQRTAWAAGLLSIVIFGYVFSIIMYRLFFHPLRKFPGPMINRISSVTQTLASHQIPLY